MTGYYGRQAAEEFLIRYWEILQEPPFIYRWMDGYPHRIQFFLLFDFDEDGIPEILIQEGVVAYDTEGLILPDEWTDYHTNFWLNSALYRYIDGVYREIPWIHSSRGWTTPYRDPYGNVVLQLSADYHSNSYHYLHFTDAGAELELILSVGWHEWDELMDLWEHRDITPLTIYGTETPITEINSLTELEEEIINSINLRLDVTDTEEEEPQEEPIPLEQDEPQEEPREEPAPLTDEPTEASVESTEESVQAMTTVTQDFETREQDESFNMHFWIAAIVFLLIVCIVFVKLRKK